MSLKIVEEPAGLLTDFFDTTFVNKESAQSALLSLSVREVIWQGKHLNILYIPGRNTADMFIYFFQLQKRNKEALKSIFRRVKVISIHERRFNICGVLETGTSCSPLGLKVVFSVNEKSTIEQEILPTHDLRGAIVIHDF